MIILIQYQFHVPRIISKQWFTTSKGPLGRYWGGYFSLVRLRACPKHRHRPASPILRLLTWTLADITGLAQECLIQNDR